MRTHGSLLSVAVIVPLPTGKVCPVSSVLLATLITDCSSCFPLPPASQVIIKSHSWKAFTMQQFDSYFRQPSSWKSQRSGLFDLMCPLQLTACVSTATNISPRLSPLNHPSSWSHPVLHRPAGARGWQRSCSAPSLQEPCHGGAWEEACAPG